MTENKKKLLIFLNHPSVQFGLDSRDPATIYLY